MKGTIVMKSLVVKFVCSRCIAEIVYLVCRDAFPSEGRMETKY
jgi:hypothetical protein